MTPQQILEIRLIIETINAQFSWCLDHGQYEGLDALFELDAQYISDKRILSGRKQIREYFENRMALGPRSSRHMCSGLRIASADGKTVSTTSVWLSFAANASLPLETVPIFMVADFFDVYLRGDDGQWRIAKRDIRRAFRNPDAAPRA